jgi:hypothetical protein
MGAGVYSQLAVCPLFLHNSRKDKKTKDVNPFVIQPKETAQARQCT